MSWCTNGGGAAERGRGDEGQGSLRLHPGTSRQEQKMSCRGGRESSLIEALATLALGQGKLPENH